MAFAFSSYTSTPTGSRTAAAQMHAAVLSAGIPIMSFHDPRETHEIFAGALSLLRGNVAHAATSGTVPSPSVDEETKSVTHKVADALRSVLRRRKSSGASSTSSASSGASSDSDASTLTSGSSSDDDAPMPMVLDDPAAYDSDAAVFTGISSMIADFDFELFSPGFRLPAGEDADGAGKAHCAHPTATAMESSVFEDDSEVESILHGDEAAVEEAVLETLSTPHNNWF